MILELLGMKLRTPQLLHRPNEAETAIPEEEAMERGDSRHRQKSGGKGLNNLGDWKQGKTRQVVDLSRKTVSEEEEKMTHIKSVDRLEDRKDTMKDLKTALVEVQDKEKIETSEDRRADGGEHDDGMKKKRMQGEGFENCKEAKKEQDTGLTRKISLVDPEKEYPTSIRQDGIGRYDTRKNRRGVLLCNKSQVALALVLVILGIVPLSGGTPVSLHPTSQDLPQECFGWMKKNSNQCPDRNKDDFNGHWTELNQKCCGRLPGTQLHCQTEELRSVLACLPDQEVPLGILGRLIVNATGHPVLDLKTECPPNSYRSTAVNSSFIPYQHCPQLKTRPELEEEKVFDGGTSRDDLFVCKKGFRSDCVQGHQRGHDPCHCERLQCKEGWRPFRNITGQASDSSFRVQYGCASSVEDTTPSSKSSAKDPGGTAPNQTLPGAGQNPDTVSSSKSSPIWSGIVAVLVPITLVLSVGFVWCRKRCRSGWNPLSDTETIP